MPKAAFEIGAVERQAPLDKIANELLKAPSSKVIENV
jgi:two-component system chemotaxis response regulator CheB